MSTVTLAPRGVRTLLTVQQFSEKHRAFTPGALRFMLFNREENGLTRAVVRVGRRILLDEEEFFGWLDEQDRTAHDDIGRTASE